jgi:hypothetical protein
VRYSDTAVLTTEPSDSRNSALYYWLGPIAVSLIAVLDSIVDIELGNRAERGGFDVRLYAVALDPELDP